MRGFGYGHAAGSGWRSVVERCLEQASTHAPGANLGFLYVNDTFCGQLDAMLDLLRERTGVQQWVGSVGIGICATGQEYLDEPAVALMLGEFPPDSFEVLPTIRGLEGMPSGPFLLNGVPANFAVVHVDPRNGHAPALVSALSKKIERALYEIFQRVSDAGVQPVERQDVAEVLRRRLLTPASYTNRGEWKQQVVSALNGICDLDDQTKKNRSHEEERFLAAFPFHPNLTDAFFEK